jgi:hypothetical protein
VVQFSHTELARIRDGGEHDVGVRPERPELLDQRGYPAHDEVVAQVHHEVVVAQELPGDEDGMRQPQGGGLPDIGHLQAERAAVTDRRLDRRGGVADHDPDVGDPRVPDRLKAVEQDGLVRHGEQLLGRGVRDRTEPGTRTPGENQGFHGL